MYRKFLLVICLVVIALPISVSARTLGEVTPGQTLGKILLQVESVGEAWYVHPDNGKRFYLKDGAVAYEAMRLFGFGISNADLAKIPVGIEERFEELDTDRDGLADKLEEALGTDLNNPDSDGDGNSDGTEVLNNFDPLGPGKVVVDDYLANFSKGKILLQVESRGEAWYINPADGKRYYMKDGDSAYQIMRFLSLGITNADLRTIPIGQDFEIALDCKDNLDCFINNMNRGVPVMTSFLPSLEAFGIDAPLDDPLLTTIGGVDYRTVTNIIFAPNPDERARHYSPYTIYLNPLSHTISPESVLRQNYTKLDRVDIDALIERDYYDELATYEVCMLDDKSWFEAFMKGEISVGQEDEFFLNWLALLRDCQDYRVPMQLDASSSYCTDAPVPDESVGIGPLFVGDEFIYPNHPEYNNAFFADRYKVESIFTAMACGEERFNSLFEETVFPDLKLFTKDHPTPGFEDVLERNGFVCTDDEEDVAERKCGRWYRSIPVNVTTDLSEIWQYYREIHGSDCEKCG